MDGFLTKIADHLNESLLHLSDAKKSRMEETPSTAEIHGESKPALSPDKLVETFHQPSIEKFLSEIMNKKPAIFIGRFIFIYFKNIQSILNCFILIYSFD